MFFYNLKFTGLQRSLGIRRFLIFHYLEVQAEAPVGPVLLHWHIAGGNGCSRVHVHNCIPTNNVLYVLLDLLGKLNVKFIKFI